MGRVTVLLVLALALTSCGGPGDPAAEADTAPTPAPTAVETEAEPEPETTAEETTTEEVEAPTTARPEPLPGLPRFTAGYTEWATLATDIPPRESDPHLGTKDVFASHELDGDRFPDGTVIVKHARRPGKNFVGLIAIMRKVEGADPAHNDWVFIEWTRERAGEPFTELARDGACWGCHMGAAEADYVWVLAD